MNRPTRPLRPVALPSAVALAALAVALTVGCGSPASSSSAAAAAPAAAPATTAASSSATPTAADSGAAVVAPGGPMRPAGDAVYFAEGGDVGGTVTREPACAADCALSGDSTAFLSGMTWATWTGSQAVGTGTEKIDDCTPNCAAGKVYPVKVIVTFTRPVHVCANGTSRWYWTQASFTWPDGLPAPFRGAGAPANPLVYAQIARQGHMSCA